MLRSDRGQITVPGGTRKDGVLDGRARARARAILHSTLPFSTGQEHLAADFATHLEACAAAYSKNKFDVYMGIMSRLQYNLRTNGDNIIRCYPISRVCKLSHKRLHEDTAHARRGEEIMARVNAVLSHAKAEADLAAELASSIVAPTAIRCPKCKAQDRINRATYQQNRADEGMKTKCMCSTCGHSWDLAA